TLLPRQARTTGENGQQHRSQPMLAPSAHVRSPSAAPPTRPAHAGKKPVIVRTPRGCNGLELPLAARMPAPSKASQRSPAAPRRRRMKGVHVALVALLAGAFATPASAAEPAVPLSSRLAGHTLNVVAWVPSPPGGRNGNLTRIMLQAYLRPDGRAM